MPIAFTGGGTGGHVFPNIAIIEEVKKRSSAAAGVSGVFYIGEKNSFEEKIAREAGIPFHGIHAGKLRRYFSLKNIIDAFKIPVGVSEAYRILKKTKPELVFAKGGYVSFPVCLAARMLKIPVWIHESDATPGLGTKICSRFASKIWLSFEESKQYFTGKNIEVVGNPIRSNMLRGNAAEGYKLTGFSKKKLVILIIGGSSGARSLNEIIFKSLPNLTKFAQIIHITGPTALPPYRPTNLASYRSFPFLGSDLAHCYAIADLIISRAGSGTIFEVLALGKPLLLIPLPKFASRGDQIENAHIFEHHGWARYLDQETLTPKKLLETISEMLKEEKIRSARSKLRAHLEVTHLAGVSAMKIADEMVMYSMQGRQK